MSDEIKVAVPVKSKWWSKVNWVQLGGVLLATSIAEVSAGHFGLDDATKVKVLVALNFIQGTATVIIKTWFTPGVIINSLPTATQLAVKL